MYFDEVKTSIFGTKLIHRSKDSYNNETVDVFKLPKGSVYKIKANPEGGFVFTKGGKAVTAPLTKMYTDDSNITAYTQSEHRVGINLELGHITPEYITSDAGHIVATDGKIYAVSPSLATTFTGHTACLKQGHYGGEYPITLGNSNSVYVCKVDDNTYELRTRGLELALDTTFDSPDIERTHYDSEKNGYVSIYSHKDTQYLTDSTGRVLKTFPASLEPNRIAVWGNDPDHIHISLYDKESNTTTIVIYNPESKDIRELTLPNRVWNAYYVNDTVLFSSRDQKDMAGVVDSTGREVIPHKYAGIAFEQLKISPSSGWDIKRDYVFGVETHDKKHGVYALDGKQLVASMYDEISYDNSGKMPDGLYKFFAEQNGYCGVINSKGKVEVPFEYKHSMCGGYYTRQSDGVERLRISDKEDNTAYFNIFADNIIATPAEVKLVKAYESSLRSSSRQTRTRTVEKTVSKYSEDEVAGIGLLGALVSGSPIGGMIAAGIASDATETVTETITEEYDSDDY